MKHYYTIRDRTTKEVVSVYRTRGLLDSPFANQITEAEYETYKAFGIPFEEKSTNPIGIAGSFSIDFYSHFYNAHMDSK